MKHQFVAMLVSVVLLAGGGIYAFQAPPPIPAKPGVATGTVQVGNITVTLTNAYVGLLSDGLFQIVLTDTPIPPEAVATEVRFGGGQRLLRSGKASGISLLVDEKGFLRNIIPFIGELRGSTMLASAGNLAAFTGTKASVTGQGSMKPEVAGTRSWSYSASWNAVPVVAK